MSSLWGGICMLSWTAVVSYPLFTFSWFQLNRHYNARYFQKRKVPLIVSQTAIMFISTCIISPLIIISDPQHMGMLHMSSLLQQIIQVIHGQLLLSIAMIMLLRIWCLNFNHKLQLNLSNSSWKKQLSSYSIKLHSSSFYTKYKNTLGSLSWLVKTFGSIYLLLCVLLVVTEFMFRSDTLSYSVSVGILSVAYLVTTIIIVVIWFKYPKFKDNMFIREELKESIWFVAVVVIIASIAWCISHITFISIAHLLPIYVDILVMDGLCYIAVLRVIALNNKRGAMHDLARNVDNNPYKFTMNSILENKNGYQEFMKFLVQEWSSESLCFATEYLQLRESLHLDEEEKALLGCNVVFHTVMSSKKSLFRCDTDTDRELDCKQFIEIVTKLYHKYIAFDTSNYEINVSYDARMSLAVLLDDDLKQYVIENKATDPKLKKTKIVNLASNDLHQVIQIVIPLFEIILLEVTRLLEQSFSRFKRSDIWNEVCDAIIAEKRRRSKKQSMKMIKIPLPLEKVRALTPKAKAREHQKFEFQRTTHVFGISKTNSIKGKVATRNVIHHINSASDHIQSQLTNDYDLDEIVLNTLQPSVSAPSTITSDAPNTFIDELMTNSLGSSGTKDSSFVE